MAKVTIIIPCYNQAEFLEYCLYSVAHQTFTHWECLLINDGSTDNTEEICQKWVMRDSRFSYFKQENQGVTKTRDFGLDIAKGEWIQFLDADDILAVNKLEKSLEYSGQSNIIICNFGMLVDGQIMPPFCNLADSIINFENLVSRWDIDFNLPIHCVLIKKELIAGTRFRTHFRANEDWIFWLEIFQKKEIVLYFLDEQLAFYRHNPDGASKNFSTVFQDNFDANLYVFNQYNEETKRLIFQRINLQNLELRKTNLNQKKYIRQLQNTKVLKYYLAVKKLFN
ncbi:MAG: glycosyltransferase family 2 protein [Flavobacteriales bacterium]|nr:glycosyltransferase family 2 protein [Flavobacteriales bacterium]